MLGLYNILSAIAVLLYIPRLILKKGPEDRRTFVRERLGASGYSKTDIWVHSVSVGEVLAALPFLKALKKEFPGKRIVLSTTTYTGQRIARDRFPGAERVMYMPMDSFVCIRKAVQLLSPDIFISVETELWPALFQSLKQSGSRIVILNGRISDRSFEGYKKINFFMKKVLSMVDYFYMQGAGDAERIMALGADRNRVGVMGNFKFDVDYNREVSSDWLNRFKGNILLAASTHKGEDEIILDAYARIKKNIPDMKLILAPRHPERFDDVARLIKQNGYTFIRRSEIPGSGVEGNGRRSRYNDIILLDTMGELSKLYSQVSIAFIGGSLVPKGGQNLLEPAYWSKPIIFGPHMNNFPIAREFIEESAALEVKDADDISKKVTDLLIKKETAADMGRRAKKIVDKNTGAVNKAIELVRGYLGAA